MIHADSRDALREMDAASIDACVCDPPYALVSIQKRFGADNAAPAAAGVYARSAAGFMGKKWDTGETAFDPAFWIEVLRVMKPGAHLVAFGGTRTYHRLVCAIEDGGFEIRDQLAWIFGSGFPKSHDVSKGIDRAAGVTGARGEYKTPAHAIKRKPGNERMHEGYQRPWRDDEAASDANMRAYIPGSEEARQWQGWGSALKPAWETICLAVKPNLEPIVLARKPLSEKTIAANVLAHGTGALNIDASRIDMAGEVVETGQGTSGSIYGGGNGLHGLRPAEMGTQQFRSHAQGRWPANVLHDGSPEVLRGFPETQSGALPMETPRGKQEKIYGARASIVGTHDIPADAGSAARFFYSAKADANDRLGSRHPTVKPVDLMAYLVKLVTPPGGRVLDPFAGSGTTGMACMREGFDAILIEREAEYVADIKRRIAHVHGHDAPLFADLQERLVPQAGM